MPILEHIVSALSSLVSNKLRAWLSMLWIIIWVFSIIVMMALGEGTKNSVVERFNSMWANLITVSPGGSSQSDVRSKWTSKTRDLIDDNFLEFVKKISWVKDLSPTVTTSKQFIYWIYNSSASVVWVRPVYFGLKNLTINNWVLIYDEDLQQMNKVAVIWSELAKSAFWNEDPIWKEIKLENYIFTVIWVLADNSQANNRVFIPLTTAMSKVIWTHYYWSLDISVEKAEQVENMKALIEQELLWYTKSSSLDDAPYSVSSLSEILSTVQEVTWTMTMFLAWIAAISLIVWWIWVMNIMLVSVTERTREIWIRKAIWACKSDILLQFLIEALFISILAGLIWIWLSFGAVKLLNSFIKADITTSSIMISFCSVVMIWIVFWILPASKASKLKPIDALRFE